MHNLHGPDRLFSTTHGEVVRCSARPRVQIQFREHTLRVDEEELNLLVQTVHHAYQQVVDDDDQAQWTLQAGSDDKPVSVVLSEAALCDLDVLLQGAWSMYVLRERVNAVASGLAEDVLRDHVPHADFPQ